MLRIETPLHSFNYFQFNIENYSESLNNNLYFNKKLFINKYGHISDNYSFDIFHKDIDEVLYLIELNKYFRYNNISKETCSYCKNCEFRRVCIDPRIPVFDNKINEYVYSSDCSYDVFQGKFN